MYDIGWKFDNSYIQFPETFYTRMKPVEVADPKLVIINDGLAKEIGVSFLQCTDEELAHVFSGNILPENADPIAQAYSGHQFGHFAMLGDGRAHLLGEHITPDGNRFDIQLKGSGPTPYARRGDGRAALGPMLREYIISESMYALGIPTTRSLAVVTTGETVRRDNVLSGAILTRVASSHVRVGTFEYVARLGDREALKQLADYVIERHYSNLKESKQPYIDLIGRVMKCQIDLIVDWLRVGFIHGVMNTDNMALSCETIDYGPCAFMDIYDPYTVFSSIDRHGRYAYANQPHIAGWNMARFAETLLPLLHEDINQAVAIAEETIKPFNTLFQAAWLNMMRKKLGIFEEDSEDEAIIGSLLEWMQKNQMDYTNTFQDLISETVPNAEPYHSKEFQDWWERWQIRLQGSNVSLESSLCLMKESNPVFIPRNHRVEEALRTAEEESDFSAFHTLLEVLAEPYKDKAQYKIFKDLPNPDERVYQTFCGT